jgi:hypothetical protein
MFPVHPLGGELIGAVAAGAHAFHHRFPWTIGQTGLGVRSERGAAAKRKKPKPEKHSAVQTHVTCRSLSDPDYLARK